MLRIGVIGFGYWGPNLVRNLKNLDDTQLLMVCDLSTDRLNLLRSQYPDILTTPDYREIINNKDIDAVVIATPVKTHFEIAHAALLSRKHVFVEKPITQNSSQAAKLIDEAAKNNLILMVDHIFVYTGSVRKIKELVSQKHLGQIKYYSSERINLGLFQSDVDVVWDLAVHDLAIMKFVFSEAPRAVSCTGMAHLTAQPTNVAYLTVFFDTSMIAHIHVNWLAPVKLRRTLIGGDKQMVVYDDLEPSEKVKVYDKSIDLVHGPSAYDALIGYRTGDMWAPKLDPTEALHQALHHFVESIENGSKPDSDGKSGLEVVKILEAATKSMLARGAPIELT